MVQEKPEVPEPTANYPGQQHTEMKRLVEENYDPAQVAGVADAWKNIGKDLTDLAVDFNILVNGSHAGWTGSAAEGARAALGKVGTFADTAGDQFTATGNAVHDQGTVAAEAKTKMPPPVEYDPKKMFTEALSSGSILQVGALAVTMPVQKAKSEGAKDEAVTVMQNRDDAMRSATTSMPAFAELPTVTQEQGTTTTSSQTSSINTSTVNPNSNFGTTNTSSTPFVPASNDGTTRTSWAAPLSTPPTVTPPVNKVPPTPIQPPMATPGPTFPPRQFTPRPPVPPGGKPPLLPGGGPNGRGPGGGGPNGRAGGGGSTPGRPGFGPTGSGQAGSALGRGPAAGFSPTGGGSAADLNGRSAGAGNARGAAGAAGAGGMGAGGAKGEGGDDQEHKAKFLIPTDEHFDDSRMVAPPVIGE